MADTRDRFEIPSGIYALSHSVGPLPRAARKALQERCLLPWSRKGGAAWPDWLGAVEGFCTALAGLLNSETSLFCPQPSVSDGFYNLLTALPGPRKRTVLMHEEAFPSLGFVVHGLAAQGFDIRLATGDVTDLSIWDRALSSDVDVALITHAHSNNGKLSPVADITTMCRERGVISIVDIAQSAGIIPINLKAWGADAMVGSCVKWLCGGPGAGYLWTSRDLLPALTPQRLGWFSHENPFEFDITDFRAADSALKFWGGTPSIAPYVLAAAGIEEIASIGVEAVRAHNLSLIRTCLDAAGIVNQAVDEARDTGTLCLAFSAVVVADAKAALDASDCHHDWRGNTVRLSFHVFNTDEEAERVGKTLSPFIQPK
jgi:selenocysteine lyase/cysteine desulfurase